MSLLTISFCVLTHMKPQSLILVPLLQVEERETEALQYPVGKDKLTLISSGLVRNGGVSGLTHGNLLQTTAIALHFTCTCEHASIHCTYLSGAPSRTSSQRSISYCLGYTPIRKTDLCHTSAMDLMHQVNPPPLPP